VARDNGGVQIEDEMANARVALSGPRHSLEAAVEHVPDMAGLHGIYGALPVWRELELGDPPDARPL